MIVLSKVRGSFGDGLYGVELVTDEMTCNRFRFVAHCCPSTAISTFLQHKNAWMTSGYRLDTYLRGCNALWHHAPTRRPNDSDCVFLFHRNHNNTTVPTEETIQRSGLMHD